jgi:hypothetical protein
MEPGLARAKARLIGFCGYAGSGKDSCADLLVSKLGYEKRSFAAPLRALALHLNPLMMIEDPRRLPKGQVVLERYANLIERDGYEATKRAHEDVRQFLVALGHGARQALGEDVWLDAALPVSKDGAPVDYAGKKVVLSDVRYENEVRRILGLGGLVVLLERPGVEPAHEAEAKSIARVKELIATEPRIVIVRNGGDLELLATQVRAIETLTWQTDGPLAHTRK